jgi:hypothetical protein
VAPPAAQQDPRALCGVSRRCVSGGLLAAFVGCAGEKCPAGVAAEATEAVAVGSAGAAATEAVVVGFVAAGAAGSEALGR